MRRRVPWLASPLVPGLSSPAINSLSRIWPSAPPLDGFSPGGFAAVTVYGQYERFRYAGARSSPLVSPLTQIHGPLIAPFYVPIRKQLPEAVCESAGPTIRKAARWGGPLDDVSSSGLQRLTPRDAKTRFGAQKESTSGGEHQKKERCGQAVSLQMLLTAIPPWGAANRRQPLLGAHCPFRRFLFASTRR